MNSRNQWTCEKVNSMLTLVDSEIDMKKVNEDILNAKHHVRLKRVCGACWKNDDGTVHCGFCKMDLPKENFNLTISHGCKSCISRKDLKRRATMRGFIQTLINDAKRSTKERNRLGRNHSFDITFEYILELIEKQQGRCAYSNIPMVFKPKSEWQCSIERLDDNKGYTKDNVKLVCLEFNTPKQWSREKFNTVFEHVKMKYK